MAALFPAEHTGTNMMFNTDVHTAEAFTLDGNERNTIFPLIINAGTNQWTTNVETNITDDKWVLHLKPFSYLPWRHVSVAPP